MNRRFPVFLSEFCYSFCMGELFSSFLLFVVPNISAINFPAFFRGIVEVIRSMRRFLSGINQSSHFFMLFIIISFTSLFFFKKINKQK